MPKSYLHSILILLYIQFSNIALKAQPELLVDPGFEETYYPNDPWEVLTWDGAQNTVALSRETAPGYVYAGHSSKKILRSTPNNVGGVLFKQNVQFQKGHTYRAKIRLRSTSDKVLVQFVLRKQHSWFESAATKMVNVGPMWDTVTIVGGFSELTDGYFGVNFVSTGVLYTDSASLVDITEEIRQQALASQDPIPAHYFGLHKNNFNNYTGDIILPPINSGLLRLWGSNTAWKDIELPGYYKTDLLDDYLEMVQIYGGPDYEVLYTMGMTPLWALTTADQTVDPNPNVGYGPGCMMPPHNLLDWDYYAFNLATHVNGKIKYFEVWNECDYGDFYGGSMATLVELTRRARVKLKDADPDIQIVAPNFTVLGLSKMDEFLYLGGGNYVDIFSFHYYSSETPENGLPFIEGFKKLLANHNQSNKPIWNTEGATSKTGITIDEQIGSLARMYIVQWAYGVSNFSWYAWDIGGNETTQLSDFVQTSSGKNYSILLPAGKAYNEIAEWLKGARMVYKNVSNNVWTIGISRDGGYVGWIVWNTEGSSTFTIPSEWGISQYKTLDNLDSNPHQLNASTIQIGIKPILLEAGATSGRVRPNEITTTVESKENSDNDMINSNYPNPFFEKTTISYKVKEQQNVQLIVYDALGRPVSRLVDQIQTPGDYSVVFQANGKPSGIYTYRLIRGTRIQSVRMVLLNQTDHK